jgi:hypothetical protein
MPFVRLPDGGVAHVKMGKPSRRRCSSCGTRWASRQCDYPKGKGTCDKHLCDGCAVTVGPDLDYCPDHPREAA